jgi:exonuclease III
MPTEEQMQGEMRLVSWNAKVNRDPHLVLDQLHALIVDHDPQVIVLQEFHQYVSPARDRYGAKWWIYAHNDWTYSNNCPVMVRKATHDKQTRDDGWDTLRTRTDWTGPQGKVFDGRTWTWVTTNSANILSLHRCTNGDTKNKAAFAEEYDRLSQWAENHQGKPLVIFGDHNIGPGDDCANSSKRLAKAIGGKVIADGGVDYAVVRDFNGKAKKAGKYGSDHAVVVLERQR